MLIRWFAPALLVAASPPPCTTVPPMLYSEIVAASEQIVVATARTSTCRLGDGGKTIRTFVTLGDMKWIRGEGGAALTLQFEGGKVNEDRLQIPEMPELRIGARYLLYLAKNGTNLSPIVGFHQGVFELVQRDGREVLVNQKGLELIGVRNDRFVFAGKREPAPKGPAAPPAVASEGFVPRVALPDAAKREAEERARVVEHDAARTVEPLPERPQAGPPPAPRSEALHPPARTPEARGVESRVTTSDKSPLVVPFAQDRGDRTSMQTLLDTVAIPGRK